MRIHNLSLKNFRNYTQQDFQFDDHMNLIIGDNAQGKTNILEAFYLLATTKSFRTNQYKEMIQFDKPFTSIKANIHSSSKKHELKIILSDKGKKAYINNQVINKVRDYYGYFNTVLFLPSDLLLIQSSPKVRRQLMDMELSKISPVYMYHLIQYQKLLKERNLYLKSKILSVDDAYLYVLNKQLSELNVLISKKRKKFCEKLQYFANIYYRKLSINETLSITYHSSIVDLNKDEVFSVYEKAFYQDNKQKSTTKGIHKDDLYFFINEKEASLYASQGQQRSIVLAVKMALLDIIKEEIGEYPVLLLDDVLSELDKDRQRKLISFIPKNIQTFITTTHIENSLIDINDYYTIRIKGGHVDG